MVAYCRFQASELPRAVGVEAPGGRRRTDGRAGHMCHGPYLTLPPGRYSAGFYVRREPGAQAGEVEIEVTSNHGGRRLGARRAAVRDLFASTPRLLQLDMAIDAVERGCELRLWASADAEVELSEVVLFRTDLVERRRA